MVVETYELRDGHAGTMGLHVGEANVRQYFPLPVSSVELELDHLCIVCALEPSFWQDRPEIHDARLSLWLEAKRLGGKITAAPAAMAMVPVGRDAFRLEVLAKDVEMLAPARTQDAQAGADAGTPMPAAPVVAFDRRKRSVAHSPERRRIGRLKDNDSPASAASH